MPIHLKEREGMIKKKKQKKKKKRAQILPYLADGAADSSGAGAGDSAGGAGWLFKDFLSSYNKQKVSKRKKRKKKKKKRKKRRTQHGASLLLTTWKTGPKREEK
jgi:hypothetical protein